MKQWLFIAFILISQEVVLFNGLLLKTHQGAYSLSLIFILFIIATTLDIVVGYCLAIWAKKKWRKGKVVAFANKWTDRFHAFVGKRGKWLALLLLGNFSFPYLNAFIAGWLGIAFGEMFIFLFIGNMINFATSLLLVLGVASFIPNPSFAFLGIIAVSILIVIVTKKLKATKI
jgi:membrane protein YqaA with SNARE-associated domain